MTYNFELSLVLAYSKNTSFLGGTPSLESFAAKKTKSWPYPVEENLFAVKEQAERVRREQGCLSNACGCSHVFSQHNSTSKHMVFLCNTPMKVHLDLPVHGRMRQRKCRASPVPILKDDWQQPKGSSGLGAPHLANWIGNIAFGKGPC